jgi:hypothetical protein
MKPLAIAFAALLVVGSAAAAEGACPHPFSNGELEKFDAFKEKLGEAKELVERSQELAGYLGGEEVELPEVLGAAFEVFDKYEDLEKTAKKPFEYGVKAIRIGMAIDCLREVKALPPTDPSARLGLIIGLGDLMAVAGDTLEAHDPSFLFTSSAELLRRASGIFRSVHAVSGVCRQDPATCQALCDDGTFPGACGELRQAVAPPACLFFEECLPALTGTEEDPKVPEEALTPAQLAARVKLESRAVVRASMVLCRADGGPLVEGGPAACDARLHVDDAAFLNRAVAGAESALDAWAAVENGRPGAASEVASCRVAIELQKVERRRRTLGRALDSVSLFPQQLAIQSIRPCPFFGRITSRR